MKWGIRTKIIGPFLVITAIFVLGLATASLIVQELTSTIAQMHALQDKAMLTDNLKLQVSKLLKPVNNYLITGDIEERDQFDLMLNEISTTIKELQKYEGDQEWERLADLVKQDIHKLSEMLIGVMYIEHPIGNARATQQMQEANLFFENLIGEAEKFHELSKKHLIGMSRMAESKSTWVQMVFYGTGVAATLFVTLLPPYLSRSIIQPLLRLHQGTQIVSQGILDHRLAIKTNDEIGDLAKEFNNMVQSISDMKKELDEKIKESSHLAITDPLTGLYNRRFCIERVQEEIRRADRYDRPLSLIMVDIDFFKCYNDTYGHLKGDELLKIFSKVLKRQVREGDFVCRTGGEEFIIILPETEKTIALQIAERLRIAIEQHPFPHKETQPGSNLTVSLGVSSYVKEQMDLEKLLKAADDALYLAKKEGKNKVILQA